METKRGRPALYKDDERVIFRIESAELKAFDREVARERLDRGAAIREAIRDWTRRKARRK